VDFRVIHSEIAANQIAEYLKVECHACPRNAQLRQCRFDLEIMLVRITGGTCAGIWWQYFRGAPP
jgi:hypothetical protein